MQIFLVTAIVFFSLHSFNNNNEKIINNSLSLSLFLSLPPPLPFWWTAINRISWTGPLEYSSFHSIDSIYSFSTCCSLFLSFFAKKIISCKQQQKKIVAHFPFKRWKIFSNNTETKKKKNFCFILKFINHNCSYPVRLIYFFCFFLMIFLPYLLTLKQNNNVWLKWPSENETQMVKNYYGNQCKKWESNWINYD